MSSSILTHLDIAPSRESDLLSLSNSLRILTFNEHLVGDTQHPESIKCSVVEVRGGLKKESFLLLGRPLPFMFLPGAEFWSLRMQGDKVAGRLCRTIADL